MPVRVTLILSLLTSLLLLCMPVLADDPPVESAIASSAVDDTVAMQSRIVYGVFSITADIISGDLQPLREIAAKGDVEMKLPLHGATGQLVQITFNAANLVITSDPRNGAAAVTPSPPSAGYLITIEQAELTTCDRERRHRHYELRAKSFIVHPDLRFEARQVAILYAGRHLFTLSRLSGDLTGAKRSSASPALTLGQNRIDGVYLGSNYAVSIGSRDTLTLTARYGTENHLAGDATVSRSVTLSEKVGGTLSLLASRHERVHNRLTSLDDLTIDRLPAVQLELDPITLSGDPAKSFVLQMHAGAGHYREHPTGTRGTRAQAWGAIQSPRYRVGPLEAYGAAGMAGAVTGGDFHRITAGQLSLVTPASSEVYANISLLRRREFGATPFLFDRVDIHDELYTEVEFPLGKKSPWRLDLANRHDLDTGQSRNFTITAIYSNDCFSYGLAYDTTTKGISAGIRINGLGTFRRNAGTIGFTQ